jgi:O-antigen/teichoic acid export membrane protein
VIRNLKKKLKQLDIHTLEVVKKSAGATVIKVFGIIAGVIVSIIMGRTLGADGLGIINLATRITSICLVVSMFGMDSVLVKNISIGYGNKDYSYVGKNIYTALRLNVPIAIILAISGIILSPWLSNSIFKEPILKWPLIIAFIVLIAQTISRIYGASLTGFRKIWQSNLVNETLSIWIVAIVLLVFITLKYEINIINIAMVFGLARIIVSVTVGTYWKSLFNSKYKKECYIKPMLKMAMPMFLVSSTGVVASNIDVVMLGWLSNAKEIGLYTVAARLAFFVSFFLQLSNAAIAPKIATLYFTKDKEALQILVKRVTLGLIAIALLIFLIFSLFGTVILNVWGTEFSDAYWLLMILSFGQLINIATGPAGTLLVMCGREKIHSKISLTGMILNIAFNLILIKIYGVLGAAIATAATVSIENVLKLYYSRKILKA